MQTVSLTSILQKKFMGTDDLRRQLSHILDDLQKKGGEIVITQRGKPQAVLLDLESYLAIEELQEQIADSDPKLIKRVNKSIAEVKKGKGIPAEEVFRKLNI